MKMVPARFFVAGCAAGFGACVTVECGHTQFVNPVPPPPPPVFNPSSPYTIPQTRETPVSPNLPSTLPGSGTQLQLPSAHAPCSVLSGHPCHPSFCGVFHRGPCFPYDEPPLGETLRLTIVSTDQDGAEIRHDGARTGQKSPDENNESNNSEDHKLDTIRDMFVALRACWEPPPKDAARHGMEYTIRFAFRR